MYYVYAYIRVSDGSPYYIGKGKGRRAFIKHRGVTTPNDKGKIVFLETSLTEVGALALERRYIRWYGRKDIGTGILHNKTDGGEGQSGRKYITPWNKGKNLSIETRTQMSNSHKGEKNCQYGKPKSIETLTKMSQARLGKPHPNKGKPKSEEHKRKLSESLKGKRKH